MRSLLFFGACAVVLVLAVLLLRGGRRRKPLPTFGDYVAHGDPDKLGKLLSEANAVNEARYQARLALTEYRNN
jgi:hypothetical protein